MRHGAPTPARSDREGSDAFLSRGPLARAHPRRSRALATSATPEQATCSSCRVVGTLSLAGCAGYVARETAQIPRSRPLLDRGGGAAFAAALLAAAWYRWTMDDA